VAIGYVRETSEAANRELGVRKYILPGLPPMTGFAEEHKGDPGSFTRETPISSMHERRGALTPDLRYLHRTFDLILGAEGPRMLQHDSRLTPAFLRRTVTSEITVRSTRLGHETPA